MRIIAVTCTLTFTHLYRHPRFPICDPRRPRAQVLWRHRADGRAPPHQGRGRGRHATRQDWRSGLPHRYGTVTELAEYFRHCILIVAFHQCGLRHLAACTQHLQQYIRLFLTFPSSLVLILPHCKPAGMGGGAASSMLQGDNRCDLDFNAVQRGDAEMAQVCCCRTEHSYHQIQRYIYTMSRKNHGNIVLLTSALFTACCRSRFGPPAEGQSRDSRVRGARRAQPHRFNP